ncbi:hypothetical protein Ancab_017236, partial [Ancistrocladus abbreviatus]
VFQLENRVEVIGRAFSRCGRPGRRCTAKVGWLSLGLERVLELSVAAMGEWSGGCWVWVFNWRWTLLQREEVWVRTLISFLNDSKPNSEMVDGCKPNRAMEVGWTWVHSKTGDSTAQSAFDFLLGPQTSVVDKQLLEPCWKVQQRRDVRTWRVPALLLCGLFGLQGNL